ncbi:ATPase component of ABC transporters with duplicated ATPase domain [Candidatus Paraburkholderia schumanniana]|nr:ATPase component of ABC transporters with duplicated ATPase domain [Candidatus Paraburkholderia schumannianae]
MLNKTLLGAMLSGALVLSYAGAAYAQARVYSAYAQARVYFIAPKDGATVTSPVHVKFGVDGMSVAPAGTMTEGTDHHHLLIDGKPVPQGTVIPANETTLHYGKAQTEADVKLPPATTRSRCSSATARIARTGRT